MTDSSEALSRRHDDLVASKVASPPSSNPFASSANILVSVPETVEIRLVDASSLADYEVWSLLTSILSSSLVGFIVAWLQSSKDDPLRGTLTAISGVLTILMIVCASTAFMKRHRLTTKVRRLRYRIGAEPIPDEGAG